MDFILTSLTSEYFWTVVLAVVVGYITAKAAPYVLTFLLYLVGAVVGIVFFLIGILVGVAKGAYQALKGKE
jgi:hypothetical protein